MPEIELLPFSTSPWAAPLERRHHPPQPSGRFGYQRFRPCLRWEFGFSCAFCLLHEVDFDAYGSERSGQMSIEHHVAADQDDSLINVYELLLRLPLL